MKNLLRGMILVVAVMLIVVPPLSVSAKQPAAKPLKIGVVFGLTGPGSETLTKLAEGVRAGSDWVNDQGGLTIKGEKYLIDLVMEDNKMSVDGAVAAVNKLVHSDQVKFMLGPVVTFFGAAIAPITEKAKVLRLNVMNPGPKTLIGPDKPHTFLQEGKWSTTPQAYDYLSEAYPQVKQVAFLCNNGSGGHFSAGFGMKEAEARGLKVVYEDYYPIGTTDFYPTWMKILKAKADALYLGSALTSWIGPILKQGRELGFKGPLFTGQGLGDLVTLRDIVGKDLATDFFSIDLYVDSPHMTPMIKKIKKIMNDKYGIKAGPDHVYGWELVWCMTQAIEEAQSLDATEVAKSWENTKGFETPSGPGTMGGLEFYGIRHLVVKPVAISRLKDGDVKHVRWVTPVVP